MCYPSSNITYYIACLLCISVILLNKFNSIQFNSTEVVRPCEEIERGAHSEKNARCGHTREKKKRDAKPKMERRIQERHDRGGSERGQYNKQGSM